MIQKFLASLNENQKKMLAVAAVFLMIALFDRLLIAPTMSKLSSIEGDITKEKVEIKQDLHFLTYKERILKQSKELAPYFTAKLATEEEMTAAFLKNIENLADEAKINLIKVTPSQSIQEEEYLKFHADLECTGKFADVINFMHLANTSKDLLKVVKFNLGAKKGEGDEIKATMTISKMVITNQKLPPKQKAAADSTPADAANASK